MTDNTPQIPDPDHEFSPLGILELILLTGAFPEPTEAAAPAEASPHDTEGIMTLKDRVHHLVDELPEPELQTAERVLQYLRATADPVLRVRPRGETYR